MPDENIGKNLAEMCIRRGNLKYSNGEIVDANLKKRKYDFFPLTAVISNRERRNYFLCLLLSGENRTSGKYRVLDVLDEKPQKEIVAKWQKAVL